MNKTNLKAYAPQARRDFIAAVAARANLLGISAAGAAPASVRGDLVIIEGREWPAKVNAQREKLIRRIRRRGFEQAMEEVAYTWFNRFAALRFMELHGYLDHGWRVLSSRDGGLPEILRYASDVSLPGLNNQSVREMQFAGTRDNELYKLLLVAQCNELSRSMPFLFEHIDDETELLLPENLLRTDSVLAKLLDAVPEEDWAEIEVIGWLYQFYISAKKDQVVGNVVKSEDIPAATQLFTPNWIVQYLVQNSVGGLWLMANPSSTLAREWPYYIRPTEQTPEVQHRLDSLIKSRISEDGDKLNPESLTVLDPACGSGHILVVAYDVLKAIYLERGYRLRDIPRLILEKNLHGLDIDDRAAQLAGFALLMKARADDRRLLSDPQNPPRINLLSLQESTAFDAEEISANLAPFGVERATILALLKLFEHTKTFGSLIQIPHDVTVRLEQLTQVFAIVEREGDLYAKAAAQDLQPFVNQAKVLAIQFDAVAANPPYMGRKSMCAALKGFLKVAYSDYERDLFSAFIYRLMGMVKQSGKIGIMTSFTWMFLSSFEKLRLAILNNNNLTSLVQLEYDAFEDAKAHVCAFMLDAAHTPDYVASFVRLVKFKGAENQGPKTLEAISDPNCGWMHNARPDDFIRVPGSPIAYWLSDSAISILSSAPPLINFATPRQGLATGENALFVRAWTEVSIDHIGFGYKSREASADSGKRWFPYNKGGERLKWYGNQNYVIDWEADGRRLWDFRPKSVIRNPDTYFRHSVSWSKVTTGGFCLRYYPEGFIYDVAGCCIFSDSEDEMFSILGAMNSVVMTEMFAALSPTVNMEVGHVANFSLPDTVRCAPQEIVSNVRQLVAIAEDDWNSTEMSWAFPSLPIVSQLCRAESLKDSWVKWADICAARIENALGLEKQNNAYYISAYGLQGELSCEVPANQLTLGRADREKDCQRLVSYAIGCMMGRYSLDEPGLIYAHVGNVGFDASRYTRFPADSDGIVPITSESWFDDDAARRIQEFIAQVWGHDGLAENLAWLAEGLGSKDSETANEVLRRYLAERFFRDHTQTYKRRPIYWKFSSGKLGAFQALVCQHRYHEGTIARLRSEYVIPLTGKMASRLELLEADGAAATSTAARNKLQKMVDALRKKQAELFAYDEKLRHYADMRISIDLDDGVKANYAKFGDLVADSKTIAGGSDD
ncbi:BREX-1 system adenine-specific DNA-methyltransferase PglX [Paraburkholderia sediminicola]|uniref:BREX-1 system adenine-specific DNA-methyltransferase PglX n=1 Tax=Paraburkholderia sediminicola TaxID=458836 RepID=UPI0038BCE169